MYTGHEVVTAFGREADSVRQFTKVNKNCMKPGEAHSLFPGLLCRSWLLSEILVMCSSVLSGEF